MVFSLCVLSLGLFSQFHDLATDKIGDRSLDSAYEGDWSFDAMDIDFEPTHFKALYTYRGQLKFVRHGNILQFLGNVKTYKGNEDLGSAGLHGEGPVRDNQLAAQCDYDTASHNIRGFGTIFIQFNHTMQDVPAYLIYRVTTGAGTVAAGTAKLSRL